MKGYFVELKGGASNSEARSRLEQVLGKGYVVFCEGKGEQQTQAMLKEGFMEKVQAYDVTIKYPNEGLVALVGSPAHVKLIDFNTGKAGVPKMLEEYISSITECHLEKKVVGRQG